MFTFYWQKCVRTGSSRRRVSSESATYSRSADSISFSYIPVASQTSHLPVEAQRPLTSMGLLWTVFFSASKLDGHWINAAIMSRPWKLSFSGGERGVGWPGLRASPWWLEGLSKDCISFWLTAILYYKKNSWSYLSSVHCRFCKCSWKTNCCKLFLGIC